MMPRLLTFAAACVFVCVFGGVSPFVRAQFGEDFFASNRTPLKDPCTLRLIVQDRDGKPLEDGETVEILIWKPVDPETVSDPEPLIFAGDGTVWRPHLTTWDSVGYDDGFLYELEPGIYRAGFYRQKEFAVWEGPPGARQSENSKRQPDWPVVGPGHPEVVTDGALGEVFEIAPGETDREVVLRSASGPEVTIRCDMEFFEEDLSEYSLDSLEEPGSLPERIERLLVEQATAEIISLQVYRNDGFPLFPFESMISQFEFCGLPYYLKFESLPPGRYTVMLSRRSPVPSLHPAVAFPEFSELFEIEVTEAGENVFSVKPERTLSVSRGFWRISGTVRDEEGLPLEDIYVASDYGQTMTYTGLGETKLTDENGKYHFEQWPLIVAGGFRKNAEGRWQWGIRLQHVVLRAGDFDESFQLLRRDPEGEIVLLGSFADEALKAEIATWEEKPVTVPWGETVEIDFVLKRPSKPSGKMSGGFFFGFTSDKWETPASKATAEFYRRRIAPLSLNPGYRSLAESAKGGRATLRPARKSIFPGEPILATYTIRNDGELPLNVDGYEGPTGPGPTFRAVRKDGLVVSPKKGSKTEEKKRFSDNIPTGESRTFSLCLACCGLELTEPGEYTIQTVLTVYPTLEETAMRRWPQWGLLYLPLRAEATVTVLPPEETDRGRVRRELQATVEMKGDGPIIERKRHEARHLLEHLEK